METAVDNQLRNSIADWKHVHSMCVHVVAVIGTTILRASIDPFGRGGGLGRRNFALPPGRFTNDVVRDELSFYGLSNRQQLHLLHHHLVYSTPFFLVVTSVVSSAIISDSPSVRDRSV